MYQASNRMMHVNNDTVELRVATGTHAGEGGGVLPASRVHTQVQLRVIFT
jgi:hypothetical protein